MRKRLSSVFLLGTLLLVTHAIAIPAAEKQPDNAQAPSAQTNQPPKQEPAISIEIRGDKEVPLVLYILPWQNPQAPLPDPPQLDDPSLRPLTPCELSDSMPAREVEAWQCDERRLQ